MKHTFKLLTALLLSPLVTLHAAEPQIDAPKSTDRPNVLFIITDQQFADAMSCRMGKQFINTPAMDSLAKSGILFTRAYAANPLCMPSRNAMFTGRYPHETGVTRNAHVKFDAAEFVDLGTYFHRAGYETAYFGKGHLSFKLNKQFETRELPARNDGHDKETLTSTLKFLGKPHHRPFLCVVSFMNPHNVCELARGQKLLPDGPVGTAPAPEKCPPAPANLAPQQDEPDTMTIMRRGYHASHKFPVGNFTPDQWRQLRWGYYRLIEKVDAQIAEVLDALRKAGQEDNTVIVFTSDHGECAGAHGFNQKTVLYEESARVPLIISYKGQTKLAESDKLINTGIDLLPTMLNCAGISVPTKLPGRSLWPVALGQASPEWRDYIVVEDNMDQAASIGPYRPTAEGRMVRTERYKYCVYSHGDRRESLVDLITDPGETKNLARDPEYRKILLEHRARLTQFGKEHNDQLAAKLLADDVKPIPSTSNDVTSAEE
jgi:arylsulfatase A-like enzyme